MKKHLLIFCILALINGNLFPQIQDNIIHQKTDMKLSSFLLNKTGEVKTLPIPKSKIKIDGNELLGVIVKSKNIDALKSKGYLINARFGDYATLRIKPGDITKLAAEESVINIIPEKYFHPTNDIAAAVTGAKLLSSGYFNDTKYTGKKVLLCFIDSGIDWSHPDFRSITDSTKSRIVYIWDETLNKTGSEITPQDRDAVNFTGLNYGVEYSNSNINAELNTLPAGFVREKDLSGHGSHTAGSAAGNGAASKGKYIGVAQEADILIIKAGETSFSSTNIINGLAYAGAIAKQLNEPVVVNMSLGSLQGPNDGTDTEDQAVDNFVSGGVGRVVTAAAGNNGQSNTHITGSISNSTSVNFSFTVPTYTPVTGTNNNYFGFDLWFNNNGAVSTTVTSPNNIVVSTAGSSVGTTDGTVFVADQISSTDNDREVYLYVSNGGTHNPASGTWQLSVTNTSGSTMVYHGWLFDSSMGATLSNGDSQYSINSPGSANSAITSGAFATKWRWENRNSDNLQYTNPDLSDNLCSFSSMGPRRDGVQKPDLSSPGMSVVSVKASTAPGDSTSIMPGNYYMIDQGTSMASPMTAGAAALLLQQNPNLSAAQIKSLLINNTISDNYTGTIPNFSWGYGKMNVFNAMVSLVNPTVKQSFITFVYDQWQHAAYTNISPNQKMAVRFSPTASGKVTGVMFHSYTSNNILDSLSFEVWSDNNGLPGSKIGNTVNYSSSGIALFTWNYVYLQGANAQVAAGSDYHIVVYFTSGSPTGFFLDTGTPNSRSSINSGFGWVSQSAFNFRIRPIVAANTLTSVNSTESIPDHFELFNNYPNPFNPSTVISYQISASSKVQLKIYDILGREVALLVNQEQQPGIYKINFNSQLASGGRQLSSGIYFYQLHAGNNINTKKMILIK